MYPDPNAPNFYNQNTASIPPGPPIKKTLKQKYLALPLWKKLGAGCIVSIGLLLWGYNPMRVVLSGYK